MHILSDMLKPFAELVSKDPVSKKDFVKIYAFVGLPLPKIKTISIK